MVPSYGVDIFFFEKVGGAVEGGFFLVCLAGPF